MTGGPLKPIQVIPPGLTGLLALKQEGRLPDMLSDLVSPVIELREWYMIARKLETAGLFGGQPSIVNNAAGVSNFKLAGVDVVVPAGQFWYVHQMTTQWFPVAATDTMRMCAYLVQPNANGAGGSNVIQVGPDVSDVISARVIRLISTTIFRPFWAGPGDKFAAGVFDFVTGVNFTITLFMQATVLPI